MAHVSHSYGTIGLPDSTTIRSFDEATLPLSEVERLVEELEGNNLVAKAT